jgi:two-component system chemotaxis sensor kinase CheA
VDFKRLDDLLSLVGELVIFKTRISQIQSRLKELPSGRQISGELKEVIESAGKTISGLQEGVMRARMMPVGFVFRKFTRMARDLARSQGKEAQVLLQGEETELDKTVIDELREPLLHLIRNAVDHGIESPSERTRAGKPPSGKITLSAIQESSYVIIKINDDGKGIDPERVRDKAVEKGLIRDGAELPEEELRQIIFTPGFSTRDSSTDISGRGIGLDIVSKNISRLNGQVSVESQKATGSTFIIKLPLSLAIIPALMAEVSSETFAIPISGVDESVRAQEQDIHVVDGKEVIRLREKIVPVLRLGDFFGLGRRNGSGRFYLVVVGKAEKKLALAVDRLAGQQEIVIKPLDDTFGQSRGISGASILGSGKIVLIVDLLNLWGRGNFSPAAPCENQGGKQDGY